MRGLFIKLAIGVAGIVLLVKYGSIDLGMLMKAANRPGLLALAFLCILATVPIAAWRWWLLLRGLQFQFTFPWAVNATFISLFFHTFLPGAYGGDLVRLALAYRSAGGRLSRLTFSVVVDRLSGLLALLALGLVMLPALPPAYASRLQWVAAIGVAAGVAGLVVALKSGDWVARLLGRLPTPVGPALATVVSELVAALRAYWTQPGRLGATVAISIGQYFLILSALFLLGHAMGFEDLPWTGYVIAGICSVLANSLPITPGGIGVGEAAFAHVALIFISSPSGDLGYGTVFLAMRLLSVIIGIGGVLPWLLNRMDLRRGIADIRSDAPSNDGAPSR